LKIFFRAKSATEAFAHFPKFEMNPLQRFIENKSQTSIQFVKYIMAGGFAAAFHFAIFTVLNETVLSQSGSGNAWSESITARCTFCGVGKQLSDE